MESTPLERQLSPTLPGRQPFAQEPELSPTQTPLRFNPKQRAHPGAQRALQLSPQLNQGGNLASCCRWEAQYYLSKFQG